MKFFNAVILLALFGALIIAGCTQSGGGGTQSGSGRAVYAMKDAAADFGSMTSVKMTVDRVEAQSSTSGWVTVSSTPKTYDLVQLKNDASTRIIADANMSADTYNQIRMHVSSVVVTDAQGTHEAKLPSNELRMASQIVVHENSTSTATFDFLGDQSLHVTGKGQYIMAPVVHVQTRDDAEVVAKGDDRIEIRGGSVRSDTQVGMDISGNVGAGLKIPADANLDVGADGKLTIIGGGLVPGANGSGRAVVGIADPTGSVGTVSSVKVTVDSVRVHSETQGWVTVSSTPKTIDLMALNASGKTSLLADAQIPAGNYTQIRLDVSKVVVTDANGTHEAKLPSGELKVKGEFIVTANHTSTAVFDFNANESLHLTGKGRFILTPVLHLETREDAEINERSSEDVEVKGGRIRTSVKVAMDVDGRVDVDVKVPADLDIDDNGRVVVVNVIVNVVGGAGGRG